MRITPKDFPFTLKDGAARTGYNLHYFRRRCKAGEYKCLIQGRHIFFSQEQYLMLPEPRVSLSLFDGLDMGDLK